jgi:hypothetical protein
MTNTTITPDRVAYETLGLIETNPELHDQNRWMTVIDDDPCKSTACVAGHAAVIAGLVEWRTDVHPNGYWHRVSDGAIMDENVQDEGDAYDVAEAWFEAGMEALAVPEMLATLLFDGSVTTATVKAVLRDLSDGVDHDTITLRMDATFIRTMGIGPRRSTLPYITS